MGGFLPSSGCLSPATDTDALSLTAMTLEDVPECAELFLRAHGAENGWDRQQDIAEMVTANLPYAT